MKPFFLLLSLIGYTILYAQPQGSLKGSVYGKSDTLESASVVLIKTPFAATTGPDGKYEMNHIPAGKYQIRISYVGHENFQQEVAIKDGGVTTLTVHLIPLDAKLQEIVVTGTLKETKKAESVSPVDVYTQKYFKRYNPTNIFDALAGINGIFPDVDNGVSNTTDVQINGLEGNYSMFLIDGVPAMNGLAGIYALHAFPMSLIDKVEVLKGSASTLYGSEAIAGVINIKTKNASNAPRFAANVCLNSMLSANADISASFKLKRASSFVTFTGESSNYRWDLDKDNFTDVPLINRASFYNKWNFNRQQSRVASIYARYIFEDRIGGENVSVKRLRGSAYYYSEQIRTHQYQTGFQYQLPVYEKFLLMADYSEHRQHATFGNYVYDGLQRTGFTQLTWNKKVDSINDLLIGAQYRLNYYEDNTGLSDPEITGYGKLLHTAGIFIEDELNLPHNHQLLIGARFDYTSANGPVFIPRINYKWRSNDQNNVIRFGAGMGYRLPNLMNEGFGALNGSRQVVVEETLKPETTINTNLNFSRVQHLKGGILNIDASVFYTYFFNMINPDYGEDPTLIEYSNSKGGAMASGFSVNADFTFNYPLKIGVGFTYTNVFEQEKNDAGEIEKEIPTHSPPFVANFFLSYTFPVPQLSIDWTGNLVSPMLLSTVPDDYRPSKSPWYTIQNIQLTKKFNSGIEIYLGVKNFFNFIQKEPILRPFDPFNKNVTVDNPNNYRFDTTYGFTSTEGIKGFSGIRYTLQ